MAGYTKVPDKKTIVAIIIIAILLIAAIVGTVAFFKNRGTAEATELENYNEQTTQTAQEQTTTDTQEQSGESATQSAEEQTAEGTETTTETTGETEVAGTGDADTTATGTAGAGATGTTATGTVGAGTTGTTTTTGGTGTTATTENIQESTITEYQTNIIPERLVLEGEDKIWTPRELQATFASAYSNIDSAEPTDVTVTKTAITQSGSTLVQAGETITYVITVQNKTDENIERIYVTDAIPEGTTYVSSMGDATTFEDAEGNVTSLRWLVDIQANSTTTVEFTVRVNDDATGTISNVAIANGEESNETKTPIIQTEKSRIVTREGVEVENATVGDNITYTISVRNTEDVEGTVTIKDTDLETILSNKKAEMVGNVDIYLNDEIVSSDKTAQDLINGISDIVVPANGEAKVVFTVKVNIVNGEILNTAIVNDKPTNQVVVNTVDIDKVKHVDKTSAKVNEDITYTIELSNKGNAEGTVTLRDSAPDGTVFKSATLLDSEGNVQENITKAQLESGNYTIIVPGKTVVKVQIVVTAVEKTANDEYTATVQNTAYITDSTGIPEEEPEPVPVPSEETKIVNITELKESTYEGKAEGKELHELDIITYTITLTNHGDAEGTAIVTDTVPEGTTLVPNTIKVNDEGDYTEQQLNEGIEVTVPAQLGTAILTFQVKVNPFIVGETTRIIKNDQAKVDGEPTNPTEDTAIPELYDENGIFSGEKVWVDGNDQDGMRPDSITVELYKTVGETKTKVAERTVAKTEGNNWAYQFTDLPKYENGVEIVYTVEEITVAGYESVVEGTTITNTHTPELYNENGIFSGEKVWVDGNDQDGMRPDSITVELYKTVGETKTKVAERTVAKTEGNNWAYQFTDLPKYENGVEIVYTVEEITVDGYESVVEGTTITNTIEQEYIKIEGTKTWDDMNNIEGKRPESITIKLLANGKDTEKEKTVPDENGNWTYKFEDLPKYDVQGNIITYTISENPVNNYNDPVYTKTTKGYDILNSMDVEETSIEKTVSSIIRNGEETLVTETGSTVGVETTYSNTAVTSGDTIIYDIVVKNEGNTTLQNVKVTDTKAVTIIGITPMLNGVAGDKETLNVSTIAETSNLLELAKRATTLEKGQGYIITVSYEVQTTDVADVSKISNTAKITADNTGDKYSTATVMVEVKFDYDIRKEITGITGKDTVSNGTETVKDGVTTIKYDDEANKGDTLTYKITAVNNGTTTIENLEITDDRNVKVLTVKFSSENTEHSINQNVSAKGNLLVGLTKTTLEPGESVEITVEYVIGSMTQDETEANTSTILNTAFLEGKAKDPLPDDPTNPYREVDDKAKAIIDANMKANITIEKTSTTNGQEMTAGSTVTYTVTLTNSSSVTGTTTVKESIPENTELVSDITVNTSETGTENPTTLTQEQIDKMAAGTLELTVPGDGWVTITFTVKLKNEAIGTTVENTAYMGEFSTDTIKNNVKKCLNIYETATEFGKQSVVIVVDMTLSLAADVNTNNTDRLAYTVGNGADKYEKGYHNTRWYNLKTALDTFIDGYLRDNPGNKKSVAIVGFCGNAITTGGYNSFYTSAGAAKSVYENVFTLDQYKAAVQFAEECNGSESKFENFFNVTINDRNWEDFYGTEYKKNSDGTYDIDVDILPIINRTSYTNETCGLSSGTNIVVGLNAGESLVELKTSQKIITNAIIITDGIDNTKVNGELVNTPDVISRAAEELMDNEVNGEPTNLYAIGFTSSATGNGFNTGVNCTEYFEATDIANLNTAIDDIIKETTESDIPVTRCATVENNGCVSLDGIGLSDNSKITFYTGNVLTDDSKVVEYANLQAFRNSGYYDKDTKIFNLKQFLIDNNAKIDAGDTINMQVYTVE